MVWQSILLNSITFGMLFLIVIKKELTSKLSQIILGFGSLALVLNVWRVGFFWIHYLLYTVIAVSSFFIYLNSNYHIQIKRIWSITLLFFFLISIAIQLVFPIYTIPEPSGANQIGTTNIIIDTSRDEIYTQNEDDTRRFKIQLWYPAEEVDGYEQALWLEDGIEVSKALSKDFGFPAFLLDQTSAVTSHAYVDAPLMNQSSPYPIVILSHGWSGFRNLHTDIAEELASQGYIAVSIDHVYGALAVDLNGSFVYKNPDALPQREDTPNFLDYAEKLVQTYGEDVISTLDYLEVLNDTESSMFQGKFDMSNIGVVGHSTGGGGVVYAAMNDARIDVLIGLDAWVEPLGYEALEEGLSIPAVFLRSESWEVGYNNDYLYALLDHSDATLYQVNGTTHFDFAMVYMYSPLVKTFGFTGEHDGEYLNLMLETVILDMVDTSLLDAETSFDDYSNIFEAFVEIL